MCTSQKKKINLLRPIASKLGWRTGGPVAPPPLQWAAGLFPSANHISFSIITTTDPSESADYLLLPGAIYEYMEEETRFVMMLAGHIYLEGERRGGGHRREKGEGEGALAWAPEEGGE